MTFNEGDVCLLVCAASFPGGDYLGFIKSTPEKKIEAEYRFRYHRDDKFFDSADKKNFYRIDPIDDTPEARARLVEAFKAALRANPLFANQGYVEVNSSDAEKLKAALESITGVEARAIGEKA